MARDAAEGGHRSGDDGAAAVGARGHRGGLSRRRQARAVRKDDGVGRAELRAHARRGAPQQQGARDRLSALYNPMYQAAYDGIIKAGVLGDVYPRRASPGTATARGGARAIRRRPTTIRRSGAIPTLDHLLNWRLYWKYSQGLMAELCSHQINAANWFFGSSPEAVMASGGVYRFPKGGREASITSTRPWTIRAAAPRRSRRSSRTRSTTITRCTWAQRRR